MHLQNATCGMESRTPRKRLQVAYSYYFLRWSRWAPVAGTMSKLLASMCTRQHPRCPQSTLYFLTEVRRNMNRKPTTHAKIKVKQLGNYNRLMDTRKPAKNRNCPDVQAQKRWIGESRRQCPWDPHSASTIRVTNSSPRLTPALGGEFPMRPSSSSLLHILS